MQPTAQLSETLLEIAEQAAQRVGPMLTEAFSTGVQVEEKGGFSDLVTEYDPKSERMIAEYILDAYPDSMILGEEGGHQGEGAVRWYIDPIDGTTNFATGIPYFCVSIGAELAGQIVAGVIYDPLRQEMFSAAANGAFLNGQPMAVNNVNLEKDAVVLTNLPISAPGIKENGLLFGQMTQRCRSVRRLGAIALDLAYLACGRATVVVGYGVKPWDVAAASLLVTQAGGVYRSFGLAEKPWLAPGFLAHSAGFEVEHSIVATVFEESDSPWQDDTGE